MKNGIKIVAYTGLLTASWFISGCAQFGVFDSNRAHVPPSYENNMPRAQVYQSGSSIKQGQKGYTHNQVNNQNANKQNVNNQNVNNNVRKTNTKSTNNQTTNQTTHVTSANPSVPNTAPTVGQ